MLLVVFAASTGVAPSPAQTPPPQIYHIVTTALCARLHDIVRPAVAMVLENDQRIAKGTPLFQRYRRAMMESGSDSLSASTPETDMTLQQMSYLVIPTAKNMIAAQTLLDDPRLTKPTGNPDDDQAIAKLKAQLLQTLAFQSASIDLINGFVQTQQLGQMQHQTDEYIAEIQGTDTTSQITKAPTDPYADPNAPGIAPNPYEINLSEVPGLAVGYNPLSRIIDGMQWLHQETTKREDAAGSTLSAAQTQCPEIIEKMRSEIMNARMISAAIAVFVSITMATARADTTVQQLTYNFTYSTNQTTYARDSSNPAEDYGSASSGGGNAMAAGNGQSVYNGSLSDKGTMTVQILGKQQDGGLIVNIAENGQDTRRAPAAACVVYGNTRVICDPNKTVYTEEYTLLRFLGQNFIDAGNLDAHRHWQIVQNSPNVDVTADYVLGPTTSSDVSVTEARKIRQTSGGSLTTDVQAKIGYDMSRDIPTSVNEYVTQRHDNGVQGTSTTIYQTTLSLASDTTAKI